MLRQQIVHDCCIGGSACYLGAMAAASVTSTNTPESDDSAESRILDAALVQFEQVGVKKTTIEDIARRAGVDRVTVYRRVGSRDDVVEAVFNREITRVLGDLSAIPDRHDTVEGLVADIFVTIIGRWRTHPLVNKLLVLEPERVLPSLTTDGAPIFTMSILATEQLLRQAIGKGLLPEVDDLLTRAEIACRVVHSLILAPGGPVALDTEDELDAFARQYLVPIIRP